MSKRDEYEQNGTCNKCGGLNDLKPVSWIESTLCEADVKCTKCGFEDYWAYGHLESTAEIGRVKCETY